MKYLDYQGLQEYDALIKEYIQDNIPDSSQAADVATALKNAANPNSNIKIAVCTQAEYNALQNPEQNVLYIISDETSEVVNVEANPTLDGTESVLGSIKIGGIKYKMPSVVANPTLDGTETALESLGINGVIYAILSGGGSSGSTHKYFHLLRLSRSGSFEFEGYTIIVSDRDTAYNASSFLLYLSQVSSLPILNGTCSGRYDDYRGELYRIDAFSTSTYNLVYKYYTLTADTTSGNVTRTITQKSMYMNNSNDISISDTVTQIS